MSRSSANSSRWITSPATPIAADTIPFMKSPISTRKACGRMRTSGSRSSARCWPARSHSSIVLHGGISPRNLPVTCTSMCRTRCITLAQQRRVTRQIVSGLYLYTAIDRTIQQGQLLTRRKVEAVPTVGDASVLEVSEEELKASILLFYSLLDEQQRRLYAGLESLKLGRGGDRSLADFLDLDPHTVARGRQQLLAQDVEVDRARKTGGGRRRVEKKRPK